MKVIAVTNRKGGVGKSTISVHLAAGLATLGYRVGLVDTDDQGHISYLLGVERSESLYELMVDKRPVSECSLLVPPENYSTPDRPATGELHLISSHQKTANIANSLEMGEIYTFMYAMDDFIAEYDLDVVFVDMSPATTNFTMNVYMGIDRFLFVTEPEALAFDGLQTAIQQMHRFRRNRENIQRSTDIIGIVPNKMRQQTIVHDENLANLAAAFNADVSGLVFNALSLRIAWAMAAQLQETMYTFKPSGLEAAQMWHLVNQVAERVNAWVAQESE